MSHRFLLCPMLRVWMMASLAIAQLPVAPVDLSVSNSNITFDAGEVSRGSQPLNKQLISLSIEFGNTVDFLGDVGSPNQFSRRLLQNIEDRSGFAPILRLGGNTQDKSWFCEDCPDTLRSIIVVDPNVPLSTEAIEVEFNPDFFRVMEENAPDSTQYIFGLNFGNNSLELAENEMRAAARYLNQSRVIAYELGNEANLYPVSSNWRPTTWGLVDYAREMLEWLPALFEVPATPPSFQFGSFVAFLGDFTLVQLTKMNVPQNIPGLEYYAWHGYPGHMCTPESAALVQLSTYLNHLTTASFVTQFEGEIEAVRRAGGRFHIGETNSAACHGKDGVSNTFGAALWDIDYALTAAASGVDRLFFHNGKGQFYYSMWEPTQVSESVPAHINPTYFSMLFVADLVSDLESPRVARLIHLDTFETVHFAVFDGADLTKVVILNTQGYYDSSGPRDSKTFDLGSVFGSSLQVRRLTAASSTSKEGVVWNGQTVDETGAVVGQERIEEVSDGVVTLFASEAAIVEAAA